MVNFGYKRKKLSIDDNNLPQELLEQLSKGYSKNFVRDTDRGKILKIISEYEKINIDEIIVVFYKKYKKILKKSTLHAHLLNLRKKKLISSQSKPFRCGIYSINNHSKKAKKLIEQYDE